MVDWTTFLAKLKVCPAKTRRQTKLQATSRRAKGEFHFFPRVGTSRVNSRGQKYRPMLSRVAYTQHNRA
jgi:hypothetical protein